METSKRISDFLNMESELLKFEASNSSVQEKELLDFIDKMLSSALEYMKEQGDNDKELQEDIKRVLSVIRESNFLEKLNKSIREAEKLRDTRKPENGKDILLPAIWLLLKLARDCYTMIRFKWGRQGGYDVLYELMESGREVLHNYYNWKKQFLYCQYKLCKYFFR